MLFQRKQSHSQQSALLNAAGAGAVETMQSIWAAMEPAQIREMIVDDGYGVFLQAINSGKLECVEGIWKQVPDLIEPMITHNDFEAFRDAAQEGYRRIVAAIWQKLPAQISAMIAAKHCEAFHRAVASGQLDMIQDLWRQVPDLIYIMMVSRNFAAFSLAAEKNHRAITRAIWHQMRVVAPSKILTMFIANECAAVYHLASHGDHEMIQAILDKVTPDHVAAMLRAVERSPLQVAAEKGRLAVVEAILAKVPADQMVAVIAQKDYLMFRVAAANGHVHIILAIWKQVPGQMSVMMQRNDFLALQVAADNQRENVIHLFLSLPMAFHYAMQKPQLYGPYLQTFIDRQYDQYRSVNQNPQALKLKESEVTLCFLMLRFLVTKHLISRGILQKIHFFQQIPAVQKIFEQDKDTRWMQEKISAVEGLFQVMLPDAPAHHRSPTASDTSAETFHPPLSIVSQR